MQNKKINKAIGKFISIHDRNNNNNNWANQNRANKRLSLT